MKSARRRSLVPWGESLEARVVQSGIGTPAAVAQHLRSPAAAPAARSFQPAVRAIYPRGSGAYRISDQVEAAFNSFTTDYLQAQALYLEAIADPNVSADIADASKNLFIASTQTRIGVLVQDLTQSLSRLPNSLKRERGRSTVPLQDFLIRNITHPNNNTSLLSNLTNSKTIPPRGTTGAAASLYTLNALNAIKAAKTATTNGAFFLSSNTFRPRH